jgi:hypothetical protein
MPSLCAWRYAGYKRRMEEVANHRMAASYGRRLILSCSFHAGKERKGYFVLTVSPYWNANEAHEGFVHVDESNRTNPERHQIG